MEKSFSALIADHSADEASTIAQVLQLGAPLRHEWVDSMNALARAASQSRWDIIVCSVSFDIEKSFHLAREHGSKIVFLASDDNPEAVLSVLGMGGTCLLRSRLLDLADMVQRLPERNPLQNESAFFEKLHRTAGQSLAVECVNPAFETLPSGSETLVKPLIHSSRDCDTPWDAAGSRLDDLVLAVAEKTADLSGPLFLQALVEILARTLNLHSVFIGVFAENSQVRILYRNDRAETFECQSSLFAGVISGIECYHPRNIRFLHPECAWLENAEGFYGLPLLDSSGTPFGLLALAGNAPIDHLGRLRPILRILASRASAELGFQQTLSLLKRSEEDFRTNFDLVSVGMAHISLDGKWLKANPELCKILEYTEGELFSTKFHSVLHPGDLPRTLESLASLLMGKIPSFSTEIRIRKSSGQALWVHMTVSILRDERNCPRHLVAVIADISQKMKSEEQIHFLANHDTLTKLPNRKFLLEKLGQKLVQAESANQRIAILLLDLDGFKLINDSLGHAAGDSLMSFCGQYISDCLEEGDLSARLGSDEFAIVCVRAETNEIVSNFSERMLKAISVPTRMAEMDISITGCIGIAVYPDDGDDISTLLRKADTAMYRAKDAGGNHYRFYHEDMASRTMDHLILVNDLRHAIDRNEFVLHYQPQVDLGTGEMTAVEALLRWNHPKRGLIHPAEFIRLAEETGLIIPIGQWVLETACRQAKCWQDLGMKNLCIAVNLSVRQFHKQDLAQRVAGALQASGLAPEHLELEITESAIMVNARESVRMLQQLKEMGIRISIDDFGTGYSSLSYLKEFPIDKIKIDQSFVENIASNSDNAALASGIIALAHSIKLSVTAEGVENLGQLNFLSLSQCDSIQGFYFCNPLPAESLQKLLEQGKCLEIGKAESLQSCISV